MPHIVETVVSAIVFVVVSILGTFLNGILILAILISHKLRSTCSAIIVALSFNDFALCLIFYPMHVYATIRQGWQDAYIICKMTSVILPICTFETITAFPMIAYNRYLYVTKPRQHYMSVFSKKTTSLLILSSWVFPALLIGIPLLISTPTFTFSHVYHMCVYEIEYIAPVYIEFSVFLLCFSITVTSYYKLIRYIHMHVSDTRLSLGTTSQLQERKLTTQAIKMMTFVSIGFCACCFPYLAMRVIDPSLLNLSAFGHKISLLILAIGSLVNPTMYTVTNVWHQRAIFSMIRLKHPDSNIPNNVSIA